MNLGSEFSVGIGLMVHEAINKGYFLKWDASVAMDIVDQKAAEIKQQWEEAGFPLTLDKTIVRDLQNVMKEFKGENLQTMTPQKNAVHCVLPNDAPGNLAMRYFTKGFCLLLNHP